MPHTIKERPRWADLCDSDPVEVLRAGVPPSTIPHTSDAIQKPRWADLCDSDPVEVWRADVPQEDGVDEELGTDMQPMEVHSLQTSWQKELASRIESAEWPALKKGKGGVQGNRGNKSAKGQPDNSGNRCGFIGNLVSYRPAQLVGLRRRMETLEVTFDSEFRYQPLISKLYSLAKAVQPSLRPETVYLSAYLIGKMITHCDFDDEVGELLVVTTTLLACKHEETRDRMLDLQDVMSACGVEGDQSAIWWLEAKVLEVLGWTLRVPTPISFLSNFGLQKGEESHAVKFLFASLSSMRNFAVKPSLLAAAACSLAARAEGRKLNTRHFKSWGHSEVEIAGIIKDVNGWLTMSPMTKRTRLSRLWTLRMADRTAQTSNACPTLEFEIGRGTFGTVFTARDKEGQLLAVKQINSEVCANEGIESEYLREISLLKSLTHKNIIQLHNVIYEGGLRLYLVFEWGGTDLHHMIHSSEHGLPPWEVKTLFFQMLEGFTYIHGEGILHRDIKPANAMVAEGRLRIGDFGLARQKSFMQQFTSHVGTRNYMSMEMLFDSTEYHESTDAWSAGCVLAEMATQELLFKGVGVSIIHAIFQTIGLPTKDTAAAIGGIFMLPLRLEVKGFNPTISHALGSAGMDLLKGLLKHHPRKRLTAQKALEHKYFHE